MATMLSSRYSAIRCVNYARRHQRLSKQVVNDNELVNGIQPSVDKVIAKNSDLESKQYERENAYDDVILSDRNLDDRIRSLYAECQQHDRQNPGDATLIKIFPDEKYGEIVKLPFLREINEAGKMVVRIESLGTEHPIYPMAGQMQSAIDNTSAAIEAHTAAIRNVKMAEAEVEIAREELIRQYEINYLDARKKYGRITAEKLFPKASSRSSAVQIDEEPEEAA
jgi:hypothetical protein